MYSFAKGRKIRYMSVYKQENTYIQRENRYISIQFADNKRYINTNKTTLIS